MVLQESPSIVYEYMETIRSANEILRICTVKCHFCMVVWLYNIFDLLYKEGGSRLLQSPFQAG